VLSRLMRSSGSCQGIRESAVARCAGSARQLGWRPKEYSGEEDGLTSQPRFIPVHALWSAAGATECGQWIEEGGDRMSDKRAQGFCFFSQILNC
jgi:hypothetical protein